MISKIIYESQQNPKVLKSIQKESRRSTRSYNIAIGWKGHQKTQQQIAGSEQQSHSPSIQFRCSLKGCI